MATEAQINANRANALKSTGPVTAEGRAASAANSFQHGLAVRECLTYLFNTEEQERFDDLRNNLRRELLPKTEIEEQAFATVAHSFFQAARARSFEIIAQEKWLLDPDNEKLQRKMDLMTAYRLRLERGAEKALRHLGKVQLDRICHNEVNVILEKYGHDTRASLAIPMHDLRRRHFKHATGLHIAKEIVAKWQEPVEEKLTKKQQEEESAQKINFIDMFLPPDIKKMKDDLEKKGLL